ncbi:MAG: hypothetical protein IJ007_04320 [Oscillospiraceae bacterium]|nr:hypothetical protein [Oscillospiraceae bacterium]
MGIVMKVLKNKWFIMFVSILNAVYTACLLCLAGAAMIYKIEFVDTMKFAIIYSVFSVIVGLLMYYTRGSFLTSIFNILNMFAFLPLLLLQWGNWPLLIPAAIVTLFNFFTCHMNDTMKTVFGTIFLLLYIVCCVAFFLIMNVFRVTTVDTVMETGVSPSGYFRYYVLNVENKSSGKTAVYVEPNTLDIDVGGVIRLDTTIKKLVKQANNPTTMDCSWAGDKMYINGEEYFSEPDFVTIENGAPVYNFEDDNWTHTYFEANYPLYEAVSKMFTIVKDKLNEFFGEEETLDIPEGAVTG